MRYGLVLVVAPLLACRPAPAAPSLDPGHAAALRDSVRAFATNVATEVSQQGPAAWRRHFLDTTAFFMAVDGRLVFPNSAVAQQAIDELTRTISHIELRWGPDLRIDPLGPRRALLATSYHETRDDVQGHHVDEDGFFSGIVVHRGASWQLLNAHWSAVGAPSPVR